MPSTAPIASLPWLIGLQTLHRYASTFPAALSASDGGRNRKAVKMLEEYSSDMMLIGFITTFSAERMRMLRPLAQRLPVDSSALPAKYREVR